MNSENHPTASLPRRFAAAGYDLLPVTGLVMLVTLAVLTARGGEPVSAGNPFFQMLLLGVAGVFFITFWCRGGQTIGMRAWRLRVETRDGGALDWRVASIRFAATLLSIAVFGLGFFWILIDCDGLAWHDRLSGTRVVVIPKNDT